MGAESAVVNRRTFLGAASVLAAGAAACALGACSANTPAGPTAWGLPDASPNPENRWGVDLNVNMETLDDYLGLPDVVYREMRMIQDSAHYEEFEGGSRDLTMLVDGFKIVPFPYIGTLTELGVPGRYEGDRLFDIEWNEDYTAASVTPRYEESLQIIEDLFPKDKRIVLMCGGGGYAGMTRYMLIKLGWDPKMVINAGGGWNYTGYHGVELIDCNADGTPKFYLWRADIAPINFDQLTPVA